MFNFGLLLSTRVGANSEEKRADVVARREWMWLDWVGLLAGLEEAEKVKCAPGRLSRKAIAGSAEEKCWEDNF